MPESQVAFYSALIHSAKIDARLPWKGRHPRPPNVDASKITYKTLLASFKSHKRLKSSSAQLSLVLPSRP